MTRKNYGYGSYFEDGKFFDKNGKEITDIKEFYSACRKKYSGNSKKIVKRKYGYGGDGSYERNENLKINSLDEEKFPENL